MSEFREKLDSAIADKDSLLCVGLDTNTMRLPRHLKGKRDPQYRFNCEIIDATADLVCAYKPNAAFYEAHGPDGVRQLEMTFDYLHQKHPQVVTILDAKRGDIDSTNDGYVSFAFDRLKADAITISPYLGLQANRPFLQKPSGEFRDKGIIVLCKTSNEGSDEFQNLELKDGTRLYQKVAHNVARIWNKGNDNCLLVVGATFPEEMAEVRKIVGSRMFILMPGLGAQGGDAEKALQAGLNSRGSGLIVNSSRETIFASNGTDFAEVARQRAENLRAIINVERQKRRGRK